MGFKGLAIGLLGLVGALLPLSAGAVQWEEVGESDKVWLYLDANSVKRRGNVVQFWEQAVLKQPDENGITSYKHLNSLNCTTANYDVLREVAYIGGQARSDTKVTWKETRATVPGSIAEAMFQRVCKKR